MIDSGKPLRTIAVVSDEPYIPWELMVPNRRHGESMERRRALGVEFAIGRWINANGSSGPQKIRLVDSLVVAPEYKGRRELKSAKDEADFVSTRFPPGQLVDPANLDHIDQTLAVTRASLLHFVCHGAESEGEVDQVIYLADEQPFASTQVKGLDGFPDFLAKSIPMVFLNACEVGRPTTALVGIGGFAKEFIELGASAVIAPLWSVKDSLAHQVALDFYSKALEDPPRPFAEILSEIRARGYDETIAEDTYAAYCFYGDPRARRSPS